MRGKTVALRTRTLRMIRADGPASLEEMLRAYPPKKPTPCAFDGCDIHISDRWCPVHRQEVLKQLVDAARTVNRKKYK